MSIHKTLVSMRNSFVLSSGYNFSINELQYQPQIATKIIASRAKV